MILAVKHWNDREEGPCEHLIVPDDFDLPAALRGYYDWLVSLNGGPPKDESGRGTVFEGDGLVRGAGFKWGYGAAPGPEDASLAGWLVRERGARKMTDAEITVVRSPLSYDYHWDWEQVDAGYDGTFYEGGAFWQAAFPERTEQHAAWRRYAEQVKAERATW